MSPLKEIKILGISTLICCPILGVLVYLDANYPKANIVMFLFGIMFFTLYSLIRTYHLDMSVKKKEQLEIDINNIGKINIK